jgi:glycosyltransferase involved in cell wall biosynthesis
VTLSIVLITFNEEQNLPRTLKSVEGLVRDLGGEIIVVDSGSTDRTVEIAKSFGAKVFVEEWKGFAAQKNSAIDKASGDWVLSLDADEEVSSALAREIARVFPTLSRWQSHGMPTDNDAAATQMRDDGLAWGIDHPGDSIAFSIPRKNLFLCRWIKHGGFWPDRKVRLFRRGATRFELRAVHEDIEIRQGQQIRMLFEPLIHHAYPTLSGYIEHMNRYSLLGAQMAGPRSFSFIDIFIRPRLTFFYNYFLRLGFLDGREGFLLHLYHATYVSWKYAKAWELSRRSKPLPE